MDDLTVPIPREPSQPLSINTDIIPCDSYLGQDEVNQDEYTNSVVDRHEGTGGVTQSEKKFGTGKQKIILSSLAIMYFTVACSYSMIAPFYPGEAKKKEVTGTITGLIFAVFPLVVFLASPVVGTYIPTVGLKFTLLAGLFLEGGTQVLFGFLDLLPDGIIFIALSFAVRIVCALGSSCSATSSMTIVAQLYPGNLATAMGVMETVGSLGFVVGPPLGGFLYSAGGFRLPFLVLGAIILFLWFLLYFILPSDADSIDSKQETGSVIKAVKIPAIFMTTVLSIICGMVMSFLDPTLQHHLTPFHLNNVGIGLMFLISALGYALGAPVFGYLADKWDTRKMMALGAIATGIGYFLLGPAPFLPKAIFPKTLWLNAVALAITGLGTAPCAAPLLADMNKSAKKLWLNCLALAITGLGDAPCATPLLADMTRSAKKLWLNCLALAITGLGDAPIATPLLADMTKSAKENGMPEDLSTQSVLSGIYNGSFFVGGVVGPTAGGILLDHIGFPWASVVMGFILVFWGLVIAVFTFVERSKRKYHSIDIEKRPLLPKV